MFFSQSYLSSLNEIDNICDLVSSFFSFYCCAVSKPLAVLGSCRITIKKISKNIHFSFFFFILNRGKKEGRRMPNFFFSCL